MSDQLAFNIDLVTPRMLVDFKAHTGVSLMSIFEDDDTIDLVTLEPEVLAGMIWLALRMSGRPEATWDDALDTPFTSIDFAEAEPDPTPAS